MILIQQTADLGCDVQNAAPATKLTIAFGNCAANQRRALTVEHYRTSNNKGLHPQITASVHQKPRTVSLLRC